MLKKIFFKLSVWLDMLKGFFIYLIVWILILFFGSMIIHQILKMGELSNTYKGDYKNLVEVDSDKMMNVVVYGEGEKTIVILPGFGSQSPVIQYKAIADSLKDSYSVAVVEYYGYGYSMITKKDRTLDNIVDEVKKALDQSGLYEYILMPHSSSNIYAMKMVQKYPENIKGIISLDGVFPAQYNEQYFYDTYLDELHNVELTSVLEISGFARILSYVKPDIFYIDQMVNDSIWGADEVSVLRNRIATSYLTSTMLEEMKAFRDNALELTKFKYPDGLPVVQLLSSDTVNTYKDNKDKELIKYDLEELASQVITNEKLQKTVVLEGNHDMQFTNYVEVANLTRQLIDSGLTDNVFIEQDDVIQEEIVQEQQEDSEEIVEEIKEEQVENNVTEENKSEKNMNIYNPDEAKKSSNNDVIVVELN